MMKRIYPLLLLFLALIGCQNEKKEVSPLFYQISEMDSLKYSQKLHDFLRREALTYQEEEELALKNCGTCCFPLRRPKRDVLRIRNHENGIDSIDYHGVSTNLTESVVDFYMKNRKVNAQAIPNILEIVETSVYPFYNQYTPKELEEMVKERQQEYEDVKNTPNADPSLVEYFLEKAGSIQVMLDVANLCKTDTLYKIAEMTRIEIDCPDSPSEYNRILDTTIEGFYHLRNYECMRYFGETYLNLFLRAHRLKRQIDQEKLKALEFLHPLRIIDFKHVLKRTIPPPTELHTDFAP